MIVVLRNGEPIDLWGILSRRPGSFALVHGEQRLEGVNAIAEAASAEVTKLGFTWVAESPGNMRDATAMLRGKPVLADIDILFWPDVAVDPLRFFASLARRAPLVVEWPGEIKSGRVRYSEPGRPDFYEATLPSEAVVVQGVSTTFPDELPYEVERI
jgi:hypothetical protein